MRMITKMIAAGLVLVTSACAGAGSGPDLGAVAPCDLLTPALRADAGLGVGRPVETGAVRSCTWTPEGRGYGVPTILLVLPDTELDEARTFLPGVELVDTEVGGFPALRATGEVCVTTVDVGSGLLNLTGFDCGRQPETIESVLANLPA